MQRKDRLVLLLAQRKRFDLNDSPFYLNIYFMTIKSLNKSQKILKHEHIIDINK